MPKISRALLSTAPAPAAFVQRSWLFNFDNLFTRSFATLCETSHEQKKNGGCGFSCGLKSLLCVCHNRYIILLYKKLKLKMKNEKCIVPTLAVRRRRSAVNY